MLGETGCHLSASRPWSCDDYERFGGLDIVVPSVSFVTYDVRDVGRISFDNIVGVDTDSHIFQAVTEEIRTFLAAVLRDDNTANIESVLLERTF